MSTIFKDLRATDFSGLRCVASACHRTARDKGWWDKELGNGSWLAPYVSMKLMLGVTELAEAQNEVRNGGDSVSFLQEVWTREDGKPEGFASELADCVIRCFDLAGWLKIDLAAVIEKKMTYNEKRSFRHGGRKA